MRIFRSLSARVVLALLLGLILGAVLHGADQTPEWVTETAQAVGGLWLSALQMTVVPLVFALLVVGIAQAADAAATGRLAARAVGLFLGLVGLVAALTLALITLSFQVWPVDPSAAAALVAGSATGEPVPAMETGGFAAWLQSLAPGNPVKAAADNAILSLVLFGVFFGFATTRLAAEPRGRIVGLFDAVGEAMIVIVRWVLWAAPVGVFALALALGLTSGIGSAGAIVHYVILASSACIGTLLISYPLGIIGGRLAPGRFFKAMAPVTAVAIGTQSSLGSLPVMIEQSRDVLRIGERTVGVVLPLAVAIFRITSPAANLTVALFVAHVMGVPIGFEQMAAAWLVSIAVSVASVGLPGQVSFFASIVPICVAMGLPTQLLPLLLAVEVIPDIFRTVGNVTADTAVTAALGRNDHEEDEVVSS